MDLELLDQTLAAHGEPRFRAGQIWAWAGKGVEGYEQMTNLPSALRETLARELPFSSLTLSEEARSSDGTVKALFQTADGRPIEAVLMRYRDRRRSICVSSQSGCPLTCTFCATGKMKFALNLDNVLAACERLPDIGITHRRTAISTVGWIPGIERLAEQPMPLRLALSLHAADEALRSELMPVNDRYPLKDVLDACRAFYERKHRRVFVEYVMLAGVNDRYQQALALARALSAPSSGPPAQPSIFKVNLIPFNPTDSPYEGSSRESIAAFRGALESRNIPVTVRLTRGRDIDAACGQLAAKAS
jgi:23S rRNA (adenine2503-C2)-methyltransferase